MITLVLHVFAFVFCVIEAFWPWTPPFPRPHFGWLAMALFFLTLLLPGR